MKSFLSLLFSLSLFCFGHSSEAQTRTQTIKVPGECGTCKKKIEMAARKGGASYASWNIDTKMLTVKYDGKSVSTGSIERLVAAAGYDTPDYPASQDAYNALDDCCKYERKTIRPGTEESVAASGCGDECGKGKTCARDGKCNEDKSKAACCSGKENCKKSNR